jgi:hypothetical protein
MNFRAYFILIKIVGYIKIQEKEEKQKHIGNYYLHGK